MTAYLYLDQDAPARWEWALEIARALDQRVTLLHRAGAEPERIDGVEVQVLEGDDPIDAVIATLTGTAEASLFVLVQERAGNGAGDDRRRRLIRDVPCALVALFPGAEPVEGGALVAVAPGPHAAAALRVGLGLLGHGVEPVEALYIEPPVGSEAELVGRRILERQLEKALGEDRSALASTVLVKRGRVEGLAEVAKARGASLVLLGVAKASALGYRLRKTVGVRTVKRIDSATVGLCRAPIPMGGRFRRWVESVLQRCVPQLGREARVDLVERVQGSSFWDFDFVTLLSLATVIAALGLVQNSAAVIIGAMLVAPLMTPILGLGLALVQGNDHLARSALRTVVLGFVNAFGLGLLAGLLHTGFSAPTAEMIARDWPDLTDLSIAFVAGLAAAYASSRPSLFAALPGVAIAAALVPPIATGGLALALGEWRLAAGACLLFLVNAVAIVLASACSLWAVGMRGAEQGSKLSRRIGWSSTVLLLALGVLLALS